MNDVKIREMEKEVEYGTREYFKLSLRDMVNSVYSYYEYDNIEKYLNNKYIQDYYLDKSYNNGNARLSKEEVEEVVREQVDYLLKYGKVIRNVYTDSEGVSYNHLEFNDED